MLERRKSGDVTGWLTKRLNELTGQARKTFSETDLGLGFWRWAFRASITGRRPTYRN